MGPYLPREGRIEWRRTPVTLTEDALALTCTWLELGQVGAAHAHGGELPGAIAPLLTKVRELRHDAMVRLQQNRVEPGFMVPWGDDDVTLRPTHHGRTERIGENVPYLVLSAVQELADRSFEAIYYVFVRPATGASRWLPFMSSDRTMLVAIQWYQNYPQKADLQPVFEMLRQRLSADT